jgi:diaminopimelate epimerase
VSSGLFKVEGAGNDFLLGIGAWSERLAREPDLVRSLCHRRRGIGADGTIALEVMGDAELRIVYRNADGSEGEFCGNATRCSAMVGVKLLGLPANLTIETGWGEIPAEVVGEQVRLELPPPGAAPRRPSLGGPNDAGPPSLITVGVPHLVFSVCGLQGLDLSTVAPPLRRHRAVGPDGANVNFYEFGPEGAIHVRTWERGVEAETLACGSGIVAVALTVMAERGSRELEIIPASGDLLRVEALADPPMCRTRLTGPARLVARVEPVIDEPGCS